MPYQLETLPTVLKILIKNKIRLQTEVTIEDSLRGFEVAKLTTNRDEESPRRPMTLK